MTSTVSEFHLTWPAQSSPQSSCDTPRYLWVRTTAGRISLVHLDKSVVVVGRSPAHSSAEGAQLVVIVGDRYVSRCHARLRIEREVDIEDLGSRYGTFVDGRRLSTNERVRVHARSAIRIGYTTLLLLERPPDFTDFTDVRAAYAFASIGATRR